MMTLGHLASKIFALGIPPFESLHCSKFNFFAIEDFLSVAKCDLYRQPIRCSSPCDSSIECSYFVGLSLPPPPRLDSPPLHHHADCVTEKLRGVFWWITVWMSASQVVSALGPVGVKHCDLHPTSLLWKLLAATLLPVCSVNRNPLQRVEKIHVEDRLWYFLGNKLTKRNLWAPPHRKSVFKFVCLFNCAHSNFSEILGPW